MKGLISLFNSSLIKRYKRLKNNITHDTTSNPFHTMSTYDIDTDGNDTNHTEGSHKKHATSHQSDISALVAKKG